jgi:LysM repeat protein
MSQTPAARKFFRTAVVVAIASSSVFGFVNTAAANSQTSGTAAKFEYVTVSAGQTLWSLAEKIAPDADPQSWMQDVVNLNGLTSTDLKPGQKLALP